MTKNQKTLKALKEKAKMGSRSRMPSLKSIHELLDFRGIKHTYKSSVNVVEYRSGRNAYVNERHNGKRGNELYVGNLNMDTSNSYYSWNSFTYANELLELLK